MIQMAGMGCTYSILCLYANVYIYIYTFFYYIYIYTYIYICVYVYTVYIYNYTYYMFDADVLRGRPALNPISIEEVQRVTATVERDSMKVVT